MIDAQHLRLSIARQCALLRISRSSFCDEAKEESPLKLALMRLIDEPFLETPWCGLRRMARQPRCLGLIPLQSRFSLVAMVLAMEILQGPRSAFRQKLARRNG